MTEIEFVGYSAVHPSDFIYDVPNGFTGYLLLLFDSPSELLIDGRLMRTAANSAILYTPEYSLQGTTQGRYLTGGVPPVRFSM